MATLPPNPASYVDTKAWAVQFYEFYVNQTQVSASNDPQPVLLAHQTVDQLARAAQSGVVMYDPAIGNVVVSKGGVWLPLAFV